MPNVSSILPLRRRVLAKRLVFMEKKPNFALQFVTNNQDMKKLFLLMMLVAGMTIHAQNTPTQSATSAPKEFHFGYLSYNDVLHAMPQYEKAQQTLASMRASYEAELKRSEDEFSKQFAEYVEGQKSFPENILLKRQKELQQLMEQSLQFKKEAQALLEKSEAEVMAPIHAKLNDVIHRIGMERGFAYVLNTDNRAYPFINGDLGTDITADVLTMMNAGN